MHLIVYEPVVPYARNQKALKSKQDAAFNVFSLRISVMEC